MEIPYKALDPKSLRGVIAEYVTRESTEYGDREFLLEEKIAAVLSQLENGSAKIVFDAKNETCNIVKAD